MISKRQKRRASRAGRPRKTERSENIRNKLLDISEALFAKHGLHGVTFTQIARQAKVTTALMHYYFADQRGLVVSIFNRRVEASNRLRMALLDQYEKDAQGRMTLEGVMEAYLRPIFESGIEGGVGSRNYSIFTAQMHTTPGWGSKFVTKAVDPIAQRLVALVQKIYPQTPKSKLYWCFMQLAGAVLLDLARTGRIDRLSGGACRSDDLSTAFSHALAYAVGGFRAVCEAQPK